MTIFEKIKAMTVEELAEFLDDVEADGGFFDESCKECPHRERMLARGCMVEDEGDCRQASIRYLMKEADE